MKRIGTCIDGLFRSVFQRCFKPIKQPTEMTVKRLMMRWQTAAVLCLLGGWAPKAGAQEWAWAWQAGGIGYDYGSILQIAPTGGLYLACTFQGPTTLGSFTLTHNGTLAGLMKLGADNQVKWFQPNCSDFCQDPDGNLIVMGDFWQTLAIGNTNLTDPYASFFLAKYDTEGRILWAQKGSSTGVTHCGRLTVDSVGNIYATGYYQNSATFGSTTLPATQKGSVDLFIAKYDKAGDPLWARSAASSADSSNYSGPVVVDKSGNVFVAGTYQHTNVLSPALVTGFTNIMGTNFCVTNYYGAIILTNACSLDAFLTKYDSQGHALWARRLGTKENSLATDSNFAGDLKMDAQGRLWIASSTFGYTVRPKWLDQYDSDGNLLWRQEMPVAVSSLSIDPQGQCVYASGTFQGTIVFGNCTLTGHEGASAVDSYVVKFNSAGTVVWAKSAGGYDLTIAAGLAADADGNVFLTGGFHGTTYFGGFPLTSQGRRDVFIAKIATTLPSFIQQPRQVTTNAGATVTFSVMATHGLPMSYQWRKDGTNVVDDGRISGATTSCLSITSVLPGDAGNYSVLLDDGANQVSSEPAQLIVGDATRFVSLEQRMDGLFQLNFTGESGRRYFIQSTTNWVDWIAITNFDCTRGIIQVIDFKAAIDQQRFYRAISP